jgi:uncharacterized OB-fold protein
MNEKQKVFHAGALDEVEGKLIQLGNKCAKCGKTSYPAAERCVFCGAADGKKVPLSEEGAVFAYSITRVPVGPYLPPIIGAYIDLPEGVRLFAQVNAGESEMKTGMKVKVNPGVIWTEKDGTEILGYRYVPVQEKEAK